MERSLTAPDQLRQRVAFALSEISWCRKSSSQRATAPRSRNYYDMLLNDAFSNYRTILEDVTLNPEMGVYLNMRGNLKANPARNQPQRKLRPRRSCSSSRSA